jgi:hypothetical protein
LKVQLGGSRALRKRENALLAFPRSLNLALSRSRALAFPRSRVRSL